MKIVSLAPSNTEILFALGLQSHIVGVTAYCDFPKAAKTKLQVGSWINPKADEIKKLQPDIVITSTIVQEKIAQNLRELGLPILHVNPTTLASIYESIVIIGEATGKKQAAQHLITKIKSAITFARIVQNKKIKPKVYIEEWHRPPFVSGNWVPELVALAGGRYDLIKAGQLSREVTTGEVAVYDPDVMILSICGFGKNVSKDLITKRKGWEHLAAVKNKNVFVINDTYLNRPGPRIYQAVARLQQYFSKT